MVLARVVRAGSNLHTARKSFGLDNFSTMLRKPHLPEVINQKGRAIREQGIYVYVSKVLPLLLLEHCFSSPLF